MCNFVKRTSTSWTDHAALNSAFVKDTGHAIESRTGYGQSTRVSTVYFGGGTPSLAPASLLSDIIAQLGTLASLDADAEITVEGTPKSFTEEHLRALKAIGVNRISLGVQSLREHALLLFNRDHSVKDSLDAVQRIRKVFNGPRDVLSMDLIYGRPGQTVSDWTSELDVALSLIGPDQFSAYQLTVEAGTPLARKIESGRVKMPGHEELEQFYFATLDAAGRAGFGQIEVSTFVRLGAQGCKHNLGYWEGRDFVGIGPGAHGRFVGNSGQRNRTLSVPDVRAWVDQVLGPTGHGIKKNVRVDVASAIDEIVVMSLRTLRGLPEGRLGWFVGRPLQFGQALDMPRVIQLCDEGFMELTADSARSERVLKLTSKGLAVSDILVPDILATGSTPR